MNLCCSVNPCYVCVPCGFRECREHWRETLGKRDFHFRENSTSSTGKCRVTNKLITDTTYLGDPAIAYYT